MNQELDILKILAENPAISQRKIAEQTGVSLGQVNFLIKKCIKKGLLKMEGQTSKSLKYNLTPKGIAEKTALTLEYIKISYSAVITLTDKIRLITLETGNRGGKIVVIGPDDEIMEIVKLALHGSKVEWKIWNKSILANLENNLANDLKKREIYYWDNEIGEQVQNLNVKAINILE